MKRNPNPKILANALFKISEQNNVLDDVNTSLIFLNDLIENERLFCVFLQSKKIIPKKKQSIFQYFTYIRTTGFTHTNDNVFCIIRFFMARKIRQINTLKLTFLNLLKSLMNLT